MSNCEKRFQLAAEIYKDNGVDVNQVMDRLDNIPLSIHAWQGDDVAGFEASEHALTGGCQVTGNYPGRARNADELRNDLNQVLKLIPGKELPVCLQGHEVDKINPGQDRDSLVVAFGMNDFMHPEGVKAYLNNIKEIIKIAKEASQETDILLAASMCGNPDWVNTPMNMAELFSDELQAFTASMDENVGFVSLFQLWKDFMEKKTFLDLTGNGVNHPNDFGHRTLAAAVCSCFMDNLL